MATHTYVNPLIAVLLGWAFAGEPLTPRVLGATGLILAAVVFLKADASRREADSGEAPCARAGACRRGMTALIEILLDSRPAKSVRHHLRLRRTFRRRDVVIEAEDVGRIVLVLERDQLSIVLL